MSAPTVTLAPVPSPAHFVRDLSRKGRGDSLLHRLPVQSEIEAVALDFFADAQADHQIDEF